MELQRATKEGVLELDRISAKIGSTVNAVWGTVEGDITKQTDLQLELQGIKDSIPVTVPADGGNADTVNGHTVECDVPADAKFTDTIYNDSALKASVANKVDLAKVCLLMITPIQRSRNWLDLATMMIQH